MKNFQSVVQNKETHPDGEQHSSGAVTEQRREYAGRTNFPLAPVQKKSAEGGLPSGLKDGIENLSGFPMEDVRVHYNSSAPSGLQALAYTQGADIHLAPGQERHLAHEAWHVVQQKQGRVRPEVQSKIGPINMDVGLEKEADLMGSRAASMPSLESRLPSDAQAMQSAQLLGRPLQRKQDSCEPAVRQFKCGSGNNAAVNLPGVSIDDYVNKNVESDPQNIADQISTSSENFRKLRGDADENVKETFGRKTGVQYNFKPKKGAGTGPAYYKDGDAFFDKGAPKPATALNIIFETANAAQAGKFRRVERDYEDGSLMKNSLDHYIDDPSELGALEHDYTDRASKRSLIQEYYEWMSCQLARPSLLDLKDSLTSEMARSAWEISFGEILEFKSFEDYYNYYGKIHRRAVQATLK